MTLDFPHGLPITHIESNFLDLMTSDNSYNDGKWSNKEYDALVKKSEDQDANNETARWNDMVQAERF